MDTLFLKSGYKSNTDNDYHVDGGYAFNYQPHVYEMAGFIATRCDAQWIIDVGCGAGEKLVKAPEHMKLIGVDFGVNLDAFKGNTRNREAELIQWDLSEGLPEIPEKILEKAVVICSDVVEHLKNPLPLIDGLRNWAITCPHLLISTPARDRVRGVNDFGPPANPAHVMEWTLDEFVALLSSREFPIAFSGYTINTDYHYWKSTSLVISGKEAVFQDTGHDRPAITAVINCFNEADFIGHALDHLRHQGIAAIVVDNHSTDGTYEYCVQRASTDPGIQINRFGSSGESDYEWGEQLKNTVLSSEQTGPGWYLHYDADELRDSPWDNISLAAGIAFVDQLGYNALDFTVVDFRYLAHDTQIAEAGLPTTMRFFEFGRRPGHLKQIKAWKYEGQTVNLHDSGGHEASFRNRRVYPYKFLLRHYPLRSPEQARKKIFEDRLPRFEKERREKGWHTHYDHFTSESLDGWSRHSLIPWHPVTFQTDYLVESLSGIGLVDKNTDA